MAEPTPKTSSGLKLAVGGSVLLVVAGLAAFWYASNKAQQ